MSDESIRGDVDPRDADKRMYRMPQAKKFKVSSPNQQAEAIDLWLPQIKSLNGRREKEFIQTTNCISLIMDKALMEESANTNDSKSNVEESFTSVEAQLDESDEKEATSKRSNDEADWMANLKPKHSLNVCRECMANGEETSNYMCRFFGWRK